jgi:hypothetical protein
VITPEQEILVRVEVAAKNRTAVGVKPGPAGRKFPTLPRTF